MKTAVIASEGESHDLSIKFAKSAGEWNLIPESGSQNGRKSHDDANSGPNRHHVTNQTNLCYCCYEDSGEGSGTKLKTVTLWTCDICGKESVWTDDHGWFGSWKDFEDKGRSGITVVCSDDCRSRVEPTKFEGNRRLSKKRGTGRGGK